MKRSAIFILSMVVWWFLYYDPDTNLTKQVGPFVLKAQCEKIRTDLQAAASPTLFFSVCWVSE